MGAVVRAPCITNTLPEGNAPGPRQPSALSVSFLICRDEGAKERNVLPAWQSGSGSPPSRNCIGALRGWGEGRGMEENPEPETKWLPGILPRAPHVGQCLREKHCCCPKGWGERIWGEGKPD